MRSPLGGIVHDSIIFLRKLQRRRLWALTVVAVLALGISGNAAMFAAFDAWVLRPLDFVEPEALVALEESQRRSGAGGQAVSPRNLADWRERQSSLERIDAFARSYFNLADEGDPARIRGARISHGLFDNLGIQPVLGRGFTLEDDQPGQQPTVALIGHRLWRERYAGDPGAIGLTIRLDGLPYEIVGVMPDGFRFPDWQEVWTPLAVEPLASERDERWLTVVGRLEPGTTIEQAQADFDAVAREIERAAPETNEGWGIEVRPIRKIWVPSVIGTALTVCLFTGAFVLLIVCANVASLMLAEATSRGRETAVRSALGASRWRLARQTLVENLILAVAAGAAGAVISVYWIDWMTGRAPVEPPYLFDMQLDGRVLLYTLAASLLAGAGTALAPMARSSGRRLFDELKAGGRSTSMPRATARLRGALVVGELALSTALVIGALLLVKSFWHQQEIDHGYRAAGLYTMQLSLTGLGFEPAGARVDSLRRLEENLPTSGVITSVGVSSGLPTRAFAHTRVETPSRPAGPQEGERVSRFAISGAYLDALGVPVVAGRGFTTSEMRGGAEVAVLSASLAQALWGEQDVIGRSLRQVGSGGEAPWLTVVGVVGNVESPQDMVASGSPPAHQLYRPFASAESASVFLVVASQHPAESVARAVRYGVKRTGLSVPVAEVLTMEQMIQRSQWVTRFFSEQLALYALIALLIAAVGIYGLVADSVAQRSNEIAIRIALGARPGDVTRAIVAGAVKLGAGGLLVGLALGVAGARAASAMLSGVEAGDPVVLSTVVLLLAGTLVLASYGPAHRAANADPVHALRSE